MVTWTKLKDDFSPDGSLRDIYVLDTSATDWQTFLDYLPKFGFDLSFAVDGEQKPIPLYYEEIISFQKRHTTVMIVEVRGISICCLFYIEQEIELFLDPREVAAEADFSALLSFIKKLGEILGKQVLLTPENSQDNPIFSFSPKSGGFHYCIGRWD